MLLQRSQLLRMAGLPLTQRIIPDGRNGHHVREEDIAVKNVFGRQGVTALELFKHFIALDRVGRENRSELKDLELKLA